MLCFVCFSLLACLLLFACCLLVRLFCAVCLCENCLFAVVCFPQLVSFFGCGTCLFVFAAGDALCYVVRVALFPELVCFAGFFIV